MIRKPTTVFHGITPTVSFPSHDSMSIYSPRSKMIDVFESRDAYYAFRYDGLYVSTMRLTYTLTWWYQLPAMWGIDIEIPPPVGDMLEIKWVRDDWYKRSLNDEFKDKLFSRFKHNPDAYIGGRVTSPISLGQLGWRHESTGEEIETIPSGWFKFGRGEYYDLRYLSWHTFPVVPCTIPSLIMVFCGLSLTMSAGAASRQRQK